MQPNPSFLPAPGEPEKQPERGPRAAPTHERQITEPKRTAMWGILLAVGVAAAGGYYFKAQNDAKEAAKGSLIAVPTAVVGLGEVKATVRVSGTISAERFAPILAPRIQGSRSSMNRGGD